MVAVTITICETSFSNALSKKHLSPCFLISLKYYNEQLINCILKQAGACLYIKKISIVIKVIAC